MSGIDHANGHRADGLMSMLQPTPLQGPRPKPEDYPFDLRTVLSAVRPLQSAVPPDAYSASTLGTEREGNAILIDEDGLLLTIGYLIVEAADVLVSDDTGTPIPAQVVGYDHDTGFGLLRAVSTLGIEPIELASSAASLREGDKAIVASQGGLEQALEAHVASRREFAGSWEYLLDEAIFTMPLHPCWSGAALLGVEDGRLLGVGSLFVQEAAEGRTPVPGNMFVPIDLLTPILDDLITHGRRNAPPRPWLGMHTTEALGHLLVAGVRDGGPAERAGIEPGDLVHAVEGETVETLAEMYRTMWSAGSAGASIRLSVQRDAEAMEIVVRSGDRRDHYKMQRSH